MSNKHFDDFLESFNPSDDLNNVKEDILNRTYEKIEKETTVIMRLLTLKNIIVTSVLIVLLSGLIPATPVNALYHSVFQKIPGYGVVETDDDYYIQAATNGYVRIEENDVFMEVRYVYIADDYLTVSAVTNSKLNHISDPDDKKAVLEVAEEDHFGKLQVIINGEAIDMQGGSVAIGSGAGYTTKGNFYLEGDLKDIRTFEIGVEGMTRTATVELVDISSSDIPDALGSSLIIDDMIIFADLERVEDLAIVTVSIITPQSKKNARVYLHDYEEKFLNDPIVIEDETGQRFYSDKALRRQNFDNINRFYFKIPKESKKLKLTMPQILYTETYDSQIVVRVPTEDQSVSVGEPYMAGESKITIDELVYLPKGQNDISNEFSEWSRIMIKSHSEPVGETNERVMRIRYKAFKKKNFEYEEIYYSAYSGLWPFDSQSGEFIFPSEEVENTEKLKLNLEVEKALIGPFTVELNE
ncbi:MAG: hypothetical protein JEZ08_04375 [Clostridiales bacterium]|nr:hypothetical protein [Clostridiales bacterium]